MMVILHVMAVLVMPAVAEIEMVEPSSSCSSLIQQGTKSRTSDGRGIQFWVQPEAWRFDDPSRNANQANTWTTLIQRNYQTLSEYISDVAHGAGSAKPQSNSAGFVIALSAVLTIVLLVLGCIVLVHVNKSRSAAQS